MNTQNESDTQQDFEALYLAYKAKYEAIQSEADHYRTLYIRYLAKYEAANTRINELEAVVRNANIWAESCFPTDSVGGEDTGAYLSSEGYAVLDALRSVMVRHD